jgi:hypothetical protein
VWKLLTKKPSILSPHMPRQNRPAAAAACIRGSGQEARHTQAPMTSLRK